MKQAQEILLALSPNKFNISLSTCCNYTQNFKASTNQAKRHHEGRNVNACIPLHAPPRIGVEHLSVNLHWSSSNVNNIIEFKSSEATVVDSKDAKCIVCADISPVQRPGKTWKKRSGALLDHEWNHSRTNAVIPMTHLFLEKSLLETQRVYTGKGVVLIDLSYFEGSSSFRSLNEFFKLIIQVDLDHIFKNRQTGTLKQEIVFLVDNGPAESPSSVLVQMLLVRLRKFLKLKLVTQVSFSEYHSKRNYVERVHAVENPVLSKHGPCSSKLIHSSCKTGGKMHHENMEAMAKEVVDCLSQGNFGRKPLSSLRGVKDDEYIFEDEADIKEFLALSEGIKTSYFLERVRLIGPEFNGSCRLSKI